MWPKTFQDRLRSWVDLRAVVSQETLPVALEKINQFWLAAPWQPYYLHWDDFETWPDAWQLLDDNIFCDVAPGLGMCYTLSMIAHCDITDFEYIDTQNANLVLVNSGKYILNCSTGNIVNNNLEYGKVRHRLLQNDIQQKIK